MLSDDVPLVVSRQLLQTFAEGLGRLEPEFQKEMGPYTLNQIQRRVVSCEEQVNFQVHFFSQVGSSMEAASPSGRLQGNPPSAWDGSGCGRFTSPSFGQGDFSNVNCGRGRSQRYNCSTHYDSGRGGRGRSLGNYMSPCAGPSARRGSSSRGFVSAEPRPYLYYRKEMVEDPWKLLNPVISKGVRAVDSDKPWLPKSIAMKKIRVSSEASHKPISQPSLAEYLAASFNDSSK